MIELPEKSPPTLPSDEYSLRNLLPEYWTLPYIALLVYTFGMVTGRVQVGTAAVIIGLGTIPFTKLGFRGARPLVWMIALLIWAAIGYLGSDYREIVSEALLERLKLVLIAILTIAAIRTKRQAQFFLAFALICFLLYPIRAGILGFFVYNYTHFGRMVSGSGIYQNSNDLAALTLLQLSVAMAFYTSVKQRIARMFALAAAGMMGLTILLTQSRAGYLAALTFVAMITFSSNKKLRSLASFCVLLAIVVAALPESTFYRFMPLWWAKRVLVKRTRRALLRDVPIFTGLHCMSALTIQYWASV